MVGEVCELVDERCYDLSWRASGKWSDATQVSGVPVDAKSVVLPFQCLILYLSVRVTQRFKQPFHNPCCSMSVTRDIDGGRSDQNIRQVVELHESYIRIRVVELGQQRCDALRSGSAVLCCCHHGGIEVFR